jgi:hypothetical protein
MNRLIYKGIEVEYRMSTPDENGIREITYCSEINYDQKLQDAIYNHYNNKCHSNEESEDDSSGFDRDFEAELD